MSRLYIPGKTEEEIEDLIYNFTTLEATGERFHIGQDYECENAKKQRCATCKTDRLELARGSYFTAIRCPNCRWEECIHDG